ncbi:hypothetical protein [Bacillus sp. P14.5]|uniref:hypothetical protein n=1 Tax=Bacillus sp. P14.5 TaxID=1983400 RepID=UPI000DEA7EF1|nr:hypothetical protein [Bacillus sp. P14.5]
MTINKEDSAAEEILLADGDLSREQLEALKSFTIASDEILTPVDLSSKPCLPEAGPAGIDPGAIEPCLFRYTYIWLENGHQFWFYPVFLGKRSIAGYRWDGSRWVFYGVTLRQIESFVCY